MLIEKKPILIVAKETSLKSLYLNKFQLDSKALTHRNITPNNQAPIYLSSINSKVQLFQKIFKKKPASKGVIALSITSEGIALALAQYTANQKTTLTHCEFISTNNKQQTLLDLTKEYKLKKYDCHLVLAADDYRLITIATPAVTDSEIPDAIRWKISDLIDFHIDDAVIDYYPLPSSKRANSEKQLEVIATPLSTVQPLVDLCKTCGLQIEVIDIHETSVRNLATLLPENDNGIAILHLQQNTGRIIIEKKGVIHLSRKLAEGFSRLGLTDNISLTEEQISLEQSNLALEIQRSFDYVESYYGIHSISGLAVIPIAENTQQIINFLNNHGITSRIMDLSTIIDGDVLLDDATQSLCASVIGSTLRNTVKSI